MSNTLYTIQNDYSPLKAQLEDSLGELTPELEQALIINKTELQSKSIAYFEIIGGKESLVERAKAERDRCNAIIKREENIINYLKSRLLDAVNIFGPFECGLVKFGSRKSEQIIVDDVNELPKEYKTIKVTETANKAELKRAIKAGESITGVELIECLNLKIN